VRNIKGGLNELAFFAGAGGGILASKLLGDRTVCAVERDLYDASVLVQRQNDGILPPFPVWSDVQTFDGRPWRRIIDSISGGFPCEDISVAGNGAGLDGERSGLWREFARVIREIRPIRIRVENSPALTTRGIDRVLGDLAAMGYNAEWGVLGAADAIWRDGTPIHDHERYRIWILGYTNSVANSLGITCRQEWPESIDERRSSGLGSYGAKIANPESQRCGETGEFRPNESEEWFTWHGSTFADPPEQYRTIYGQTSHEPGRNSPMAQDSDGIGRRQMVEQNRGGTDFEVPTSSAAAPTLGWWQTQPGVGMLVDGMAHRVDQVRALGKGQVPIVGALAFTELESRINALDNSCKLP
jgi:DNA (cytosine-5)-methyltransferase 1